MISVGIFNGYFPYTLEESIKRIKAMGFTSVQLDLSFKGMDLLLSSLTQETLSWLWSLRNSRPCLPDNIHATTDAEVSGHMADRTMSGRDCLR